MYKYSFFNAAKICVFMYVFLSAIIIECQNTAIKRTAQR